MAREDLSGPDYQLYWTRYYTEKVLADRENQSPEAVALAIHVRGLDEYMNDGGIPRDWVPI